MTVERSKRRCFLTLTSIVKFWNFVLKSAEDYRRELKVIWYETVADWAERLLELIYSDFPLIEAKCDII